MADSQMLTADPELASPASVTPRIGHAVRGLVISLRPHQWVKNTLVFGGLIFSHSLLNWTAVGISLGAFVAFCLVSSGVYLLNDLRDLDQDCRHPLKRLRPLASGALSPSLAWAFLVMFMGGGILAAYALQPRLAVILAAYLVLNVAYSFGLKRMAILDVMLIALGFVLRAVGGAVAIGVHASPWLILCTLVLALLVGFGKRRHELSLLHADAAQHRPSLEGYSLPFLDIMMAVSGGAAVVTYALYTMAEETVARFGAYGLFLTIPWVLYGVFRYLYLVYQSKELRDPATMLVTDVPSVVNALLWTAVVCFLIYGPTGWYSW